VIRLARALLTALCLGAMLVAVGALLLPALLGYQRYVITGGSMTGTIPKGAVIYSRLTPLESLREGDVITFVPPGLSRPVTHRIVSVTPDEAGELVFRTKGDFNETADPWEVHLADRAQARYAFHVPYLGYVLAALAIRQVRMLLIGLPAVIIAISLLVSLWREAGEALEETGGELVAEPATPFDGMSESELREYRGWWWDG
jgi:signal peptidase I